MKVIQVLGARRHSFVSTRINYVIVIWISFCFPVGWLGATSWAVSMFSAPVIIAFCRRKSTRLAAVIGGLVLALGILFTSFATQFHQVALSYGELNPFSIPINFRAYLCVVMIWPLQANGHWCEEKSQTVIYSVFWLAISFPITRFALKVVLIEKRPNPLDVHLPQALMLGQPTFKSIENRFQRAENNKCTWRISARNWSMCVFGSNLSSKK